MLYERGKIWWVQFRHAGKLYRLSTNCRDRKAAEREARRLRVEVEEREGPGGSQGVTLAVLEQLDAERCERKGYSETRIKTVRNLWHRLQSVLGEHRDAMTITAGDIAAYEGERRKQVVRGENVKGQTIRRETQALMRGLKLAKRDRLITRYPFDVDDLESIESDAPRESQEAKARPLEEIELVLSKLSTKAKTAGYDRMLRLILATGVRLEEFRRIEPSWVKAAPTGLDAAGVLELPATATKTGEPRVVPLTGDSVATINELGATFRTKKFNHALVLASKAAGVTPTLTPRDLRATHLDLAAQLSGDPVAAQRLGGHSNIATTGLYLSASVLRALSAGLAAARMSSRDHSGRSQSTEGDEKDK